MEKQLKCFELLTLQEMALRRVAVDLWSDPDILASISKLQLSEHMLDGLKEWVETYEEKIQDKRRKLELPQLLTEEISKNITLIGFEIRRWKFIHEVTLSLYNFTGLPDSTKLCWTTTGTIDYRKTAEELVRCDAFRDEHRFQIACHYCLEDIIPHLWEELTEAWKGYFYNQKPRDCDLTYFWPCTLVGELSEMDYLWRSDRNFSSLNQYAFENSAQKGLKTAAEYFFRKLTEKERRTSLMRTARAVMDNRNAGKTEKKLVDVFFFLLSLMTPEQRKQIFETRPVDVLLRFLHWPWQDLFSHNAALVWTFLPSTRYHRLLREMADKFNRSEYYFKKEFQEFFIQSPHDFKKHFVEAEPYHYITPACDFLCIFFKTEDSETVEVIFRNVDAADRVKMVFRPRVFNLFGMSMMKNRFHMVEVCLREAGLSREDRARLKEEFTNNLKKSRGNIEWGNENLKRFFEFLEKPDEC